MDELERLRAQKAETYLKQQQETAAREYQEKEDLKGQMAEMEAQIRLHMTKEAISRYGTLKAGHPDKAIYALVVMSRFIEEQKIQIIDDEFLKRIIIKINKGKKEFKIKRV